MKLCHLQVNGGKWRISSYDEVKLRSPKAACSPLYVIVDLLQRYYGTLATLRGGCAREGQRKRRKPKT
jgi:hypothetical protein